MILIESNQIEPQDVGKILGKDDLGVTIQWLVHVGVGDQTYNHNFALRQFTFQPGTSFPMHHHKYVEAVYTISGKGYFETPEERVEVQAGDVIYTAEDEPHALGNAGAEIWVFTCAIDCIKERGGNSCDPNSKAVCMVLDE